MGPDEVLYLANSTVLMILYLSMPVIGAATAVGLLVALLQTLIQLQEQTLAFAVKLTTIVAVFLMSGGWMASQLMTFQDHILTRIGAP